MRTEAEWETTLQAADDLVAKGWSVEIPRWEIRTHLRGLLRDAIADQNTRAQDRIVFALDTWNQKS